MSSHSAPRAQSGHKIGHRPKSRPRSTTSSATEVAVFLLHLAKRGDIRSASIIDLNRSALEICGGRANLLVHKPLRLQKPFQSPGTLERCQFALSSGEHVEIRRPAGKAGTWLARAVALSDEKVVLTLEDGAARAAVEQKIRRSEESLHLLIHGVKDYAIYMLDPKGSVLSWNEGAERLIGYRADEIIGKNFGVFFTSEDRKNGRPQSHLRRAEQEGQSEEEGWLIKKEGWAIWANTVITALHDDEGRLYGFAKITRDMTERREREESIRVLNEHLEQRIEDRTAELVRVNQALQSEIKERKSIEERLRALAAKQESVREDERARLAREIHDALGQLCTALKMDISWIAKHLPAGERRLAKKAEAATHLVGELIKSLRELSTELRPSTLDALGLAAAIEWQAQQFQVHTGIRCKVDVPEKDLKLDKEMSTALFRIFQEALTNVARHSAATKVQATLSTNNGTVVLAIHDNGQGFLVDSAEKQGSLGLLGMRERAHLLGGYVEITSSPRQGTRVTVRVPMTARSYALVIS